MIESLRNRRVVDGLREVGGFMMAHDTESPVADVMLKLQPCERTRFVWLQGRSSCIKKRRRDEVPKVTGVKRQLRLEPSAAHPNRLESRETADMLRRAHCEWAKDAAATRQTSTRSMSKLRVGATQQHTIHQGCRLPWRSDSCWDPRYHGAVCVRFQGVVETLTGSLISVSIRRMVIAASVANLKLLILLIPGSNTPAFLLSRTVPLIRSRPILQMMRDAPAVASLPLEVGLCWV
jgi:hypothetical protein